MTEKKEEVKVEQLAIVNVDKIADLMALVYEILCKIGVECGLDD